jgi:hypothetical protein
MKAKQPHGEPMDLANMRSLGVRGLAVKCLQPACRHAAIVSVDDYPDDMLVQDFAKRMVCAKCGARGRHIDVRPNWLEQPERRALTGKVWR